MRAKGMGNAVWVYLTVVTIFATEGMMVSVFPAYLHEQGSSSSFIGMVSSLFFLASLLIRMPAGLLYSGRTSRSLMIGSLVAMSVCSVLYGVPGHPWLILLVRVVHGFGYGVATTVNLALFFEVCSPTVSRAKQMGIYSAALAAGKMLGAMGGGWIAQLMGFPIAFAVSGAVTIAGIWFTLAVQPPGEEAPQSMVIRPPAASVWQRMSGLSPLVWVSTVMQFHLNFLRAMWEAFFPVYAVSVGLSIGLVGLLRGLDNFFGIFSRLFSGELGRFVSETVLTHVGMTVSALLITLQSFLTRPWLLGAVVLALSASRAVVTVTSAAGVIRASEEAGDRVSGMGAAVFSVGKDLGNVMGPMAGGLIADWLGLIPMMRFLPTLMIGFYGVSMLLVRLATSPRTRARPLAKP